MEELSEDEIIEERMECVEALFYPLAQAVSAAEWLGERALAVLKVDEVLDEWLRLRGRRDGEV